MHSGKVVPALVALLIATPAAAQLDPAVELEPLVVEGERGELDSIAGVWRNRLPCVGSCEDVEDEPDALQRLLEDMRGLFIANSLPLRPHPQDSLGIVNPVKARLDQKLP